MPPIRHYCSYFDHRYLPRAMVLMDSIWAYNPDSRFFVLCLDQHCKEVLDRIADPRIVGVPLAELEAYDPELLATKTVRSLVEYYFTCTPCFPRFVMERYGQDIALLTYVDADLKFFADPEMVYDGIGDGSIAIVPHNFSPERQHLVQYGKFNVGWVSWRNDGEGRRCLEDYRRDCIAWCHDRIEGDRFADQKYLDKWPERYRGVRTLDHPGINLAGWNINNHHLSRIGDILFVSDRRLVFWHYHALKELGDGRWAHNMGSPIALRHPFMLEHIYRPYVRQLERKRAELIERHGLVRQLSEIRYDQTNRHQTAAAMTPESPGGQAPGAQTQEARATKWRHLGATWPDDDTATGWNAEPIVRDRLEQLARLRQRPSWAMFGDTLSEQTMVMTVVHAVQMALKGRTELSVLDWGGELGGTLVRLRKIMPGVAFRWVVKEMPSLCRAGRALSDGAVFVEEADKALAERYDLVIASASLHYDREWRKTLAGLVGSTAGILLLARQPTLMSSPSYVAAQPAYGTTFTCWVLNEAELFGQLTAWGMGAVHRLLSGDRETVTDVPEQPVFRSYVLIRR